MKLYVCGFLFSHDRSRVVLIRKNRPVWQAGKLNGVGGKIEPGETPLQAMTREFQEEAGVAITDWLPVLTICGAPTVHDPSGWRAVFFRAFHDLSAVTTRTDEKIEIHPVSPVHADVVQNLKWMIPMMLDEDVAGGKYVVAAGEGLG